MKKISLLFAMLTMVVGGAWASTTVYEKGDKVTDFSSIEDGQLVIIDVQAKSGTGHLWYTGSDASTWYTASNYCCHNVSHANYASDHVWKLVKSGDYWIVQSAANENAYLPVGDGFNPSNNVALIEFESITSTLGDFVFHVTNYTNASRQYIHINAAPSTSGNGEKIGWWGALGDATDASASCLKLTVYKATARTSYDVTYKFKMNDKVVYTASPISVVEGSAYPDPKLPYGVTATKPEGTVTEDVEPEIACTYTPGEKGFNFYDSYDNVNEWSTWTRRYHWNDAVTSYVYYVNETSAMGLTKTAPETVSDSYLWAAIGNPFSFKVVNKAAGKDLYLGDNSTPVDAEQPKMSTTGVSYYLYANDGNWGKYGFEIDGATTPTAISGNGNLNYWVNNGIYGDAGCQITWTVAEVKANMRLTSAEWGTFCAPYAVEIPGGVKAYTGSAQTKEWVKLNELTEGTIPANTAVVVYKQGVEDAESYDFYGVAVTTPGESSCFTGNTGAVKSVNAGDYILQKNNDLVGWYKVGTTAVTIGRNRCYLEATNVPNAARASYMMSFGDETTGINNIATEAATKADGKYLVNGKFVVVKAGKAYDANGTLVK